MQHGGTLRFHHNQNYENETSNINSQSNRQFYPQFHSHSYPQYQPHPYIGLKAKLSRAFVNHGVLLITFMIFKLIILLFTINDKSKQAKTDYSASCNALQATGNALILFPTQLAINTNMMITSTVNEIIQRFGKLLALTVKTLKFIFLFFVDRYLRFWTCLLTLILEGTVGALAQYSDQMEAFIQKTLSDIRGQLSNVGNNIKDGFNSVTGAHIPSINIPDVHVPTDFLNVFKKIPLDVFENLLQKLNNLLSIPFDKLEGIISSAFENLKVDIHWLPTPKRKTLSLCKNVDTSWIDTLANILIAAIAFGILILIGVAITFSTLNGQIIKLKHAWFMKRVASIAKISEDASCSLFSSCSSSSSSSSLRSNLYLSRIEAAVEITRSSHYPFRWKLGKMFSDLFKSIIYKRRSRWFMDYILHPPSILFFFTGLLGILIIAFQFLILNHSESILQTTGINDLSNAAAHKINESVIQLARDYANDANMKISALEDNANHIVFGWVNTTVDTINGAITTILHESGDALQRTLPPPLAVPVVNFLKCLFETRLILLEDVLSIVQEDLKFVLPRVNDTLLNLSPDMVSDVVKETQVALVGNDTSGDSSSSLSNAGGILGKFVKGYKTVLYQHLQFFVFVMMFGCIVTFLGLGRLFSWMWHDYRSGTDTNILKHPVEENMSQQQPPPQPKMVHFSFLEDEEEDNQNPFSNYPPGKDIDDSLKNRPESPSSSSLNKNTGLKPSLNLFSKLAMRKEILKPIIQCTQGKRTSTLSLLDKENVTYDTRNIS